MQNRGVIRLLLAVPGHHSQAEARIALTEGVLKVSGADSRADRRTGCRGADRQQCFQVDASDIHPRSLALAREFAPVTENGGLSAECAASAKIQNIKENATQIMYNITFSRA